MNIEEQSIWNLIAILMRLSIEDLEVLRPIWIKEVEKEVGKADEKADEKEECHYLCNKLIDSVIQSKRNEFTRINGTI